MRGMIMDIDSMKDLIFGIIGGSALIMYGVDLMGDGLEKAAGKVIKKTLQRLTKTVWSSFLVGTIVTALVQSSTAVTVLTVGFVNANFMSLKQAVGIIYGANIGTTFTAQLMAFDLTRMALPILSVGVVTMYFAKRDTIKNIGQGILGCGMLFLGLRFLNSGVPFLRSSPEIVGIFQRYSDNLLVSVIIGTISTALVQSSAAIVGITMVLAGSGMITIDGAVGLMLGSNIGTCMTAQIAAAAGNTYAKRTAWAHTIYNIVGVIIALIIIKPFIFLVRYVSPGMSIEREIANSHTLFNLMSAIIFLPFTNKYVKFIESIVPKGE